MSGSKKVMIIDDSKLIRMTLRRMLECQGVEVVELDRVEPLLDEPWRAGDVDLLILDINLPGLDGIAALQRMQTIEALKCLPVMILTTYSDRKTVFKAIEYGAVEFMTKPINNVELINRVESIIGPLSDGISDCVYSEVSRAKRGGTPLSIINVAIGQSLSSYMMKEFQKQIQEQMRGIDSVLISRQHTVVVVLPVTGESGCAVVTNKIRKVLAGRTDVGDEFSLSCAYFPEDGETADCLLAKIQ